MRRSGTLLMLAAVAALALVAGGCGGKSKTASNPSGVAPQQRVKTALRNVQKINSGVVKLDATISGGGMPGSMKVTGGGKFDLKAAGGTAFDLDITLDIAGQSQKLGIVAVNGKSFMKFGDKAFSMGDINSGGTSSTGELGAIKPAEIRKLIDSLDTYLSDFKQTGTTQVDGETLTVYTAKVDTKQLSSKVSKEAGGKIPAVPGLGDIGSLTGMFGDIVVSIGVGDDDLPHSVGFETSFGASGASGASGAGAGSSGAMKVNLALTKVNEPVTIEAPKNVVKGADALGALGTMFGGMGSAMGGGATGTTGGPSGGR